MQFIIPGIRQLCENGKPTVIFTAECQLIMESIVNFACAHVHSAHWIFFLLLMLAGLSFPISEDLILLSAGALASTCIPDETFFLFCWLYAGCWFSAWEAYGIGRYFEPKIYDLRWFRHIVTRERITRLHHYYEKFGVFTFIIGRFIPGGVRNALFMTAGLGKMPFLTFILRDGFACLISTSVLFYIGYSLSANYELVIYYFKTYNVVVIVCIILIITIILTRVWWIKSKHKSV
ncbi:MAG TPA: DedA family protein [Parachlamydiaceae bacterium]|nr:DedA family protein [Parachlamydiaceae bacterium]